MAQDLRPWDELHATWAMLPEALRTAVTAALVAHTDARLRELSSFYPASYGDSPSVTVLGVIADSAAVTHVHFIADHLDYNNAQSGSDWAEHHVFVGKAVLDGDRVGPIELTAVISDTIREADWPRYRSSHVVEEVRDRAVRSFGFHPPVPETEEIRIVRCPQCGATDAGATEYFIELTRMTCGMCGHSEVCDEEEIKDNWNTHHTRRKDAHGLPAHVEPIASDQAGFQLQGQFLDPIRLLVHPALGYSIAVPAAPSEIGPSNAQSAILQLGTYFQAIVRTHGYYFERSTDELLRRELEATAKLRALDAPAFDVVPAPVPPGATASMCVSYPRFFDDHHGIELVALTLQGVAPSYRAVFVYFWYPAVKLDAFDAANLRAALLSHQSWIADAPPSRAVWPDNPAFSTNYWHANTQRYPGKSSWELASQLGTLTDEQAARVRELLMRAAGTFDPPSRPWTPADSERVTRAIADCAAEQHARVLARDLPRVTTMHDFRAWCGYAWWAVEHRGQALRG